MHHTKPAAFEWVARSSPGSGVNLQRLVVVVVVAVVVMVVTRVVGANPTAVAAEAAEVVEITRMASTDPAVAVRTVKDGEDSFAY